MDFNLIERIDGERFCYKLLKATFYRDYYVVIAQNKHDFACGSFCSTREDALFFFREIAKSETDPFTLNDIIGDYQKERL